MLYVFRLWRQCANLSSLKSIPSACLTAGCLIKMIQENGCIMFKLVIVSASHSRHEIAYGGDHRPFHAQKRVPHETIAGCCSAHAMEPWGGATRAISLRKREGEASKRLQPAWIHNLSNCPFRVTARPLYAAPRQRGSNCTTLGPRRFYQGMGRPLQAATRGVTTSRSYIVFTGTFYNLIISSTPEEYRGTVQSSAGIHVHVCIL